MKTVTSDESQVMSQKEKPNAANPLSSLSTCQFLEKSGLDGVSPCQEVQTSITRTRSACGRVLSDCSFFRSDTSSATQPVQVGSMSTIGMSSNKNVGISNR